MAMLRKDTSSARALILGAHAMARMEDLAVWAEVAGLAGLLCRCFPRAATRFLNPPQATKFSSSRRFVLNFTFETPSQSC
jgi:hypothetical protein